MKGDCEPDVPWEVQRWLLKRKQEWQALRKLCIHGVGQFNCDEKKNLSRLCRDDCCHVILSKLDSCPAIKQTQLIASFSPPTEKEWKDMKPKAGFIKNGVLFKFEFNEDAIFRIDESLSINAEDMERAIGVRIFFPTLLTVVEASTEEIKAHKTVRTFHDELKYYYPCKLWTLVYGEPQWYDEWIAKIHKKG